MDVVLDPVALTTAPFYDPEQSPGFGLVVIPAPGVGLYVNPLCFASLATEGDPWWSGAGQNDIQFYWSDPGNEKAVNRGDGAKMALGDDPLAQNIATFVVFDTVGELPWKESGNFDWENKGIVIVTADDFTDSGASFGTRSLLLRIWYKILATIAAVDLPIFFRITGVNTAGKTFTVNGDAHTLTGAGEVVGSPDNDDDYMITSATLKAAVTYAITNVVALSNTISIAGNHAADFPVGGPFVIDSSTLNDGPYTVASSTFVVDRTDIVPAETLPDDTVDGNVSHPDETVIAVSETIPEGNAGGWFKQ